VIPLQSNDSPNDAFENINLDAHCDAPRVFDDLYQFDLQNARKGERIAKLGRYVQWLPRIVRNWLDERLSFDQYQPVFQNGQQAGLTEQDTVAIYGWTRFEYEFLNPIAWGKPEVTVTPFWETNTSTCTAYRADVLPLIEVVLRALSKLPPIPPNVTLFRGDGRSAEELGSVITGGFMSTTNSLDAALLFAFPQRTLWAIESSPSGKDITKFSAYPQETEILLPNGTRLEVVKCSPTTFDDAMQQKVVEFDALRRDLCMIDDTLPCSNITVLCMKETTAALEEWTTAAPEEWTTAAPEEWTTAAPEEWTTTAPEEWTTAAPEERGVVQI